MPQFGKEYFKLSPELLSVFDLDGNFIEINPSWAKTLGWSTQNFLQTSFINFVHPEDKEITMEVFRKLFSGEIPTISDFENRYRNKDGHYHWFQWSASLIKEDKQIFCVARDITFAKRETLLFEEIQEVSLVGSWEIDLQSNEYYWSKMCHKIHGTEFDTYRPNKMSALTFYSPSNSKILQEHLSKLISSGENYDLELPFINALGESTWVRCIGRATWRKDTILRVFGTIEDIGKKKLEQKKSLDQQKIFETIVNNIPIMITFFDEQGNIEWINPHWTEILGWELKDLKCLDTMSRIMLSHNKDQKNLVDFVTKAPAEWKEFLIVKKDGDLTQTIWTNVKLNDGKTIGIGQDIGEKRMQEELIKDQQARMLSSAKLSSLGEVASGIAHEINNPLAIIKGKAYQILKRLEAKDVDVEFLTKEILKIDSNCQRIMKIIKGLKTYSRNGEKDPFQKIPFKNILDDVIELCQEKFKNHDVVLKTSGDLSIEIFCQETQFAQVLLNLISNAHDAVSQERDSWIEVHIETNNLVTSLYITDSGLGISDNLAQKIMQPFFTTKDVGTGTGLGLSISKGIIENHGGSLFIDRNCKNTRFVIQLPPKLPAL